MPADAVSLWTGCGDPLALCELHGIRSVLEVGSGAGLDLALTARRLATGGRVTGIDFHEEMCQTARRVLEEMGAEGFAVHQAPVENLPLDDDSCELAISNGLLSLLHDKNAAIAEVERALSPSGVFVVSEIVLEQELLPWLSSNKRLTLTGVAGALSLEGWFQAFTNGGFDQVEVLKTTLLDETQLVDLIDQGISGIEVAGCSASGAIQDIEAAALLQGTVAVAVMRASRSA